MSSSVTGTSTCSNNRMEAYELSYNEVTVLSSGGIISKQMKIDLRKQLGYCLTCPNVPVLLTCIRRSRINPLWISKKPRTEDGECIEGRCLKCSPKRDASYGTVTPSVETASRNVQLTRTLSVASSISSCSIGSTASRPIVSATESGRMLPPRTPSRSTGSSGSTNAFYGATSKHIPTSSYGSKVDGPMRDRSRGQSALKSCDDIDSDTDESQRTYDHVKSKPTNGDRHNFRSTTRLHSSPISLDESRKDGDGKNLKQEMANISYCTSKIEPIQAMLNEMKCVGQEIYMESILTVMESNQADLQVQAYCLATINDELENDNENDDDDDGSVRDSFITMSATKRVVEAMRTFPTSVVIQESGSTILLTMASYDENRTSLIESAACKVLQRAIEMNCRETSIVEKCFSTLRILSTEIEGRNSMLQLNVSNSVVAAMQYNISCVSIQQDGCAILSNLTVDILNNSVALVSIDEIAVIVEAMQVHHNDEAVMASACFALKNFTYNELNLRSMNRSNNILEALEDAALQFDSLTISASQTSEKLYLSQAEDESLVDHANTELMRKISTQSHDPDIMAVILESLRKFKWSSNHVGACLKKLKPLALTSQPHLQAFVERMTLKELLELIADFPSVETVKSEVNVLARLFTKTSDD